MQIYQMAVVEKTENAKNELDQFLCRHNLVLLTSIKPLERFAITAPVHSLFYCLPAVEKVYTPKEKKEMEKSSEDPFVQLQQFKLPSLVLQQVCILCGFRLNSTSRKKNAGKNHNCEKKKIIVESYK